MKRLYLLIFSMGFLLVAAGAADERPRRVVAPVAHPDTLPRIVVDTLPAGDADTLYRQRRGTDFTPPPVVLPIHHS